MVKSEIQMVRSLADKRSRSELGLFLAEGEKLIREIVESPLKVEKIYTLDGEFDGENVEWISPKEMERISQLKSANNSLALVQIPQHKLDVKSLKDKLVIALDNVQNPGNLGTIIRLADWFGIEDIICSESSADCYNPKVVQASMGAILRVRVHYTSLPQFVEEASAMGMPIYGTFLEGENIYKSDLSKSGVIVMGNEGQGISDAVAAAVSDKLYIPPYPVDEPSSESLNVSVATAIICSEFRRR